MTKRSRSSPRPTAASTSPVAVRHETRLDLFAKAFPTERYLREVLADLFRKMGHSGVRITHGPLEKGKDIVFYSEGPLHEKKLYACVVKNAPITGQAEDHQKPKAGGNKGKKAKAAAKGASFAFRYATDSRYFENA